MKYFGNGLSELHKELNSIIRKRDHLDDIKRLFLELHSHLHSAKAFSAIPNEYDAMLDGLKDTDFCIMPTAKDETIAWALWHIARIEDITMNILVANREQVFNSGWKTLMNASISDTGNSLTDDEIIQLSRNLSIDYLLQYRNEVGKRSQEIISNLNEEVLRQKITKEAIDRILQEGGVTNHKDSIWLLDFWSKKDVAGILLMPPTRHMMLHINDCCKWKEHIKSGKKCFL